MNPVKNILGKGKSNIYWVSEEHGWHLEPMLKRYGAKILKKKVEYLGFGGPPGMMYTISATDATFTKIANYLDKKNHAAGDIILAE